LRLGAGRPGRGGPPGGGLCRSRGRLRRGRRGPGAAACRGLPPPQGRRPARPRQQHPGGGRPARCPHGRGTPRRRRRRVDPHTVRAASDSAMLAGPPGPEVLVPRGGAWGTRVCDRLDAWGARGWVLPLIRTELVRTEQLERAGHDLQYGRYDWVAQTSAAAVTALPPQVGARIAVVGPATARAVTEAGHTVAYQPAEFSARGMLDSWHPTGKVLLLQSDLAAPTLADGLREQGTAVTDVIAYRTLPADVPAEQAARLRSGAADAALITSGSVARALADLHPPAAL